MSEKLYTQFQTNFFHFVLKNIIYATKHWNRHSKRNHQIELLFCYQQIGPSEYKQYPRSKNAKNYESHFTGKTARFWRYFQILMHDKHKLISMHMCISFARRWAQDILIYIKYRAYPSRTNITFLLVLVPMLHSNSRRSKFLYYCHYALIELTLIPQQAHFV